MILTTLPATTVRTARRGDGGLHPGTASQLTIQAGNGQTALAGTAVPIVPTVLVRDQLNQPVAGASVQFVVTGGSSSSEVAADAFTRANENPLAGNWTKAGGVATNLQLVSNAVQGVTLSGEGLMFYNAITWPADHYSECRITGLGASGSRGGGPAVRMSAAAETAYIAQVQAAGTVIELARFAAGTYTLLQQITTAVGSTDTIRLEARGSTLRVFKNGGQVGTDVIDGTIVSGNAGLDLFSNTTFTLDHWAGGVPPTTSGTVTPDTVIASNAAGLAAATVWTLGTVPGTNTLTVTIPGLVGSPATFTATGTSGGGVATQIAVNAGDTQTATVGTTLPIPPSVIVRDAGGTPVAGVLVTFAVATGGGSLTGASQNTNASGIATVGSWTLGATVGPNTLTASSAGLTGSPVTVTATGAAAANWYVSPTGLDSNPGSVTLPFATIQKAASVANPGDVILVEDGTWTDTHGTTPTICEISRGGVAGNPITLRARNKWGAKLDGVGGAKIGIGFQGAVGYWIIDGLEITGMTSTSGSAAGIECFAGGANTIIRNCHIHDIGRICTLNGQGQDGIFIERDNVTVERNVIHDIGRLRPEEGGSCYGGSLIYQSNDHGIYCDDGDNTLIRNNLFYNCKSGWAIQLYSHDHIGTKIINNTFAFGNPDRHRSFILFGVPETNGQISNNIFYDTVAGAPIHYLFLSGTVELSNNVTTGAAMVDQTNGSMTFVANQVNTNALLVNPPTDFKLQAGSPAINTGKSFLTDVPTDYDGVVRPIGGTYDVGAYEYAPGGAGDPSPGVGATILFDARAGGANDIQQAGITTLAQADALLVATNLGTAANWGFTTNQDGAGRHAYRVQWPGQGTNCADAQNSRIIYFNAPYPTHVFFQWKQWMGRTATGGGIGTVGAFTVHNGTCSDPGRKLWLALRAPDDATGRVDFIWHQATNMDIEGWYDMSPSPGTLFQNLAADFVPATAIAQVNTYTLEYQAESAAAASDGLVRLWVNGVLRLEYLNQRTGTQPFAEIQFPTTYKGPPVDQTEYYWDLLAWKV